METKIKKLLDSCKCGVYIQVNEYRDIYRTIKEWLDDLTRGECPLEISQDVRDKMIETNTIINIIFYPNTPVGSHSVYHYDLEAALDLALECLAVHEH